MKKALLLVLSLILLSYMVGCTNIDTATNRSGTTSEPTDAGGIPMQFFTERDFVDAIKSGNTIFDLKSMEYYFHPKSVPHNAQLLYILVQDTYVLYKYTFDESGDSWDSTKIMELMWHRNVKGDAAAFIKDITGRLHYDVVDIRGQAQGTTFMASLPFSQAKAVKDGSGYPTWHVSWVQGGDCFSGWIPFSIPEADIAQYLVMEKVMVE